MRETKNVLKGYTDIQVKLREATSNDPWGPSTTQLQELADSSFNPNLLLQMLDIINKRLNDHGKNWRHVFKTLVVLDYLLHAGAEESIRFVNEHVYLIKTLVEFQYIDEDGRDQGKCIRDKSSDIISLLNDKERLQREREQRLVLSNKLATTSGNNRPSVGGDEYEQDLQKALELSKQEFYKEQKYREHSQDQRQFDSNSNRPMQSPVKTKPSVDLITVDQFEPNPNFQPQSAQYDPFELESNYVAAPVSNQQGFDPFSSQQQGQQQQLFDINRQTAPQPQMQSFDFMQQPQQPYGGSQYGTQQFQGQNNQQNPFGGGSQMGGSQINSNPFGGQQSQYAGSTVSSNPFGGPAQQQYGTQSQISSNPFGSAPPSQISSNPFGAQQGQQGQLYGGNQSQFGNQQQPPQQQPLQFQRGGFGNILEPTALTNVNHMPVMIPSLTGLPAQKAPVYNRPQGTGTTGLVNLDNIFDEAPPKQFGKQSSSINQMGNLKLT